MIPIRVSEKEMRKILNKKPIEFEEVSMKNKLVDLNNYLFEALERINDDSLSDEELEKELKRAQTTTQISATIIKNADVMLKGSKFLQDQGIQVNNYQTAVMLGYGGENKPESKKEENKDERESL